MDQTDYCTSWWDGWPTWLGGTGHEWANCCKMHDEFYASQPTLDLLAFLGAHARLASCVATVNWAMAVTMFVGLCTLGFPYLLSIYNKFKGGNIDRKGNGR